MDVTTSVGVPEKTGPGVRRPAPGAAPLWMRLAPTAFVLTLTIGLSLRDPHVHGSWGVCPTYGIFGVFCPGCGSLRALYDLVHGRIGESVGHNALVIPALMFMLWSAAATPGPRWSRVWLVAVIGFTVLRNLPGSPLAA